ncbi:MAG: hypothetical protein PVF22_08635 [Candidatus Aminicenantes bacterium]
MHWKPCGNVNEERLTGRIGILDGYFEMVTHAAEKTLCRSPKFQAGMDDFLLVYSPRPLYSTRLQSRGTVLSIWKWKLS